MMIMKKPILILLSLIILISACNLFFDINVDNGSIDEEVVNDLSISDPALLEWSRFWGGDQYEVGISLAIDSNENVIVGGQTNSFGTDYDLCLVKYNTLGDEIWNSTIVSEGDDWAQTIALDSSENIYVVGYSSSGTFPNIDQNMFLLKFNSSGNLLWQTTWGGGEPDYGDEILIDSFDNVYIAGRTYSYGAGSSDVFIIKYNSTGTKLWESIWGGINSEDCSKIALDSNDNLYITGDTHIGSYYSIYLVKYNSSGSIKWESIWDRGFTSDNSEDMLIDSSDNIYITGSTTYWSSSDRSVVLIKFNNNGDELWWESWRGPPPWDYDDLYGQVLALDSAEDIYIAGKCTYDLYPDDRDVFLLKFDSQGNEEWYDIWGGDNIDSVRKILVDPSDDIFLIGSTGSYGDDLFLLKHNNLGTFLGEIYWGGSNYIVNYDMTLDSLGNIYVTGEFDNLGPTNDDLYLLKYENTDPQIEIISPVQNQIYGNMTFNFNLTIIEPDLDSTWYTLNDSTKFFFTGNTGVIDQTAWDTCGNGTLSLKFYANDSIGNVGYEEVLIQKNFNLPFISIISPENDSFYKSDPPGYLISYGGHDINSTWYSLNNGPIHYFSGISGTIDLSAWNSCEDGLIVINFYINDSSGWFTYDQVIINKDTLSPNISILTPTLNQLCGIKAIDYSLDIIEVYQDSIWYRLNDGESYFVTSLTGTIDQEAWNVCGNGTVNIKFYVNDSSSNQALEEITVRKDTSIPELNIISPVENQLFGKETIDFNVSISSSHLEINKTWYSLNYAASYFFTGYNGTIDQSAWNSCGNGSVILRIYANNSVGNTIFDEVIVYKDELGPNIMILNPIENAMYGNLNFDFALNIEDANLNSTWYSLNGGTTNYTFTGMSGIIEQSAWDDEMDGTVILTFYANDSLGNLGSANVTIIKDTISPIVTINLPIQDSLFGNGSIYFELNIDEDNLEFRWYTLDGGLNNYTFTGISGTVDQTVWDNCSDGLVYLQFFAEDYVGHLSYDEIIIEKDSTRPELSIINPTENSVFGDTAFTFNLTLYDPHLNTTWYSLDGGITTYSFTGTSGTVDQSAWDSCNDGLVYLQFYAEDSVGNYAFIEILIYKSFTLIPKRAFAIVVGVSNYPGSSSDLMYCRSDAISMHTMLRTRYNFESSNIILLTDAEATRSAIFSAFTTIGNQLSTEDIFFFSFSGHGGEAPSGLQFICPYDSMPSNPSAYLYDVELDMLLDQLQCSEKYVMIDACNSGGFISEVQAGNRYLMTACEADQLSWETSELRHGVFTYYFIDSIFVAPDLNGDGVRSLEEQFSYARSETIDYMFGFGELQQPTNYDGVSGQTVLFPSIGSLSLVPIGNELHYSFYMYGNGFLKCLNITLCSVVQNINLKIVDLKPFSPSSTGFGYYSGVLYLEEGYNVSGYEIRAEIEGYGLKTISNSFGDTDNDGLYDILEILNNIDPTLNDTDFDGLSDYDEYYGTTSPILYDTDGDGMPDGYEVYNGLNPQIDDTNLDLDGDGLINILEFNLGTYANDPDTDNDGMFDGYEYENDLNLFVDDGSLDNDGDTLENILEYQLGSFSNNDDTDGDGLDDGWEYTNGLDLFIDDSNLDPDNDGLDNLGEYQNDTDPNVEDTDGDTWNDGDEVDKGTDPLDPDDYPRENDNAIPGYLIFPFLSVFLLFTVILIKKIQIKIKRF